MSGVKAENLQSLTQVTSVIARATLEPSEVTVDTQVFMCKPRVCEHVLCVYCTTRATVKNRDATARKKSERN